MLKKQISFLKKPTDDELRQNIVSAYIDYIIFSVFAFVGFIFNRSLGIIFFMFVFTFFISQKLDKIRLEIRDIPNKIILEVQQCSKKNQKKKK